MQKYDVIVLDIPRNLNHFSHEFLTRADKILLVTELSLQSLRDTLRLSDLMRDKLKIKSEMVVINRAGVAPKNEISVVDFEKGIGEKTVEKINYLPDIFMHVGTDIPAVVHAKNVALKPLYNLAKHLLPSMHFMEKGKNYDLLGFFKKKKPDE